MVNFWCPHYFLTGDACTWSCWFSMRGCIIRWFSIRWASERWESGGRRDPESSEERWRTTHDSSILMHIHPSQLLAHSLQGFSRVPTGLWASWWLVSHWTHLWVLRLCYSVLGKGDAQCVCCVNDKRVRKWVVKGRTGFFLASTKDPEECLKTWEGVKTLWRR